MLQDVSWRIKQEYDLRGRGGSVYAEDLNIPRAMLTGYSIVNNSPGAGSIAWSDLHLVYAGVDYAIANGNTANRFVWWITTAPTVLQTGDTKPTLNQGDCLIFVNNAGVATVALSDTSASLPTVVADGAVDQGALAAAVATSIAQAQSDATDALTAAQQAQATADGAITTYYQSDPPWPNGSPSPPPGGTTNADVGDVWYDSDTQQAYRWSGSDAPTPNTWVLIEDTNISQAITAAANAQATADGKTTAYYQLTAPTTGPGGTGTPSEGDIWYNVAPGTAGPYTATAYYHDGAWVDFTMGGGAIAEGAITSTNLNVLQHLLY